MLAAMRLPDPGAREEATKASRLGIPQAWSIDHLHQPDLIHNYEVLTRVSVLLLEQPELRCEVHGRTSTPRVCDPDLAAHFGLDPALAMRQVMDRLAYERASACVEALVARGVQRAQLSASFEGCTAEQKVVFIPRDTFHVALAPPVGTDVSAVFQRYDADRSGDLDLVELRTALVALGLPVDMPEAAAVLARYDADLSGRLELDEFAKLVEQLRDFQAATHRQSGASANAAAADTAVAHRPPPPLPASEARAIFDRFDVDRSGSIDYVELREALRALGMAVDVPQAEQVLAKFDADASGRLEFDELRTLAEELRAFVGRTGPAPHTPAPHTPAPHTPAPHTAAPRAPPPRALPPPAAPPRALPPQAGSSGTSAPTPALGKHEKIRRIFDDFDRDNSGTIDLSELREALRQLGVPTDLGGASNVLAHYDESRSGRLEYAEFKRLVIDVRTAQAEAAGVPPPQTLPQRPPTGPPAGAGRPPTTGTGTGALPPARPRGPPRPPGPKPPPPPPDARAIFDRFDVDRSGSIDYVELREALRALGMAVDVPQAEQVLAKFDADASGRLEFDEFRTLLERLRSFESAAAPPRSAGKLPPPPRVPSSTTERPPPPKLPPPAKTPPTAGAAGAGARAGAGGPPPPLPTASAGASSGSASQPPAPRSKLPPPRPKASS